MFLCQAVLSLVGPFFILALLTPCSLLEQNLLLVALISKPLLLSATGFTDRMKPTLSARQWVKVDVRFPQTATIAAFHQGLTF
jgi:hypothetical protein